MLISSFSNVISTATAFTTEAVIGSGQEMTLMQLHRNFTTISDETGASITLPDLSSSSKRKMLPAPGIVMRSQNPLFNPLQDNAHTMVNLVPLDEKENKYSRRKDFDHTSV